jgi:probable FeS assembly SUF system protein SufT
MSRHARWVTLNRDCEALLVPSGMPFMIPSGTGVEITQAKGGSITININGQLARIDSKDALALGIELTDLVAPSNKSATKIASGPVDLEQVWDQLRTCYDPEIPVNIVDLGLIYDCRVEPNVDFTQNHVYVTMTLTAPGCGMGPVLMNDVEDAVWRVENVTAVSVEMVFDPPWDRDMISDAGKLELGLF